MSKDKNKFWLEPLISLLFSVIVLAIPFVFFPSEVKAVSHYGFVKAALYLVFPATLVSGVLTYVWRDDPNKDWIRTFTIVLAVAFAIAVTAPSAQYRQDKIDNIQYDHK